MARPRAGLTGAGLGGAGLGALAAAVPLAFLGLLFAWPVAAVLRLGLRDPGGPGGPLDVLADPSTWELVGFTLGQAAASTVLTLLAGLPVAWLLARAALPGRWLLRVVVTVPFVLPTVVVGLAVRALLGEGVLPILLAHAFFNTAVVARTVGGLWAHLDPRAEEAARSLGAPPWRAFLGVTLPALAPAIASAAAVVFLFCATSFGVVLVLGAGRYRTLETEVYLRTVALFDLRTAATLSLLQLAAVVAVLLVGARARRRREVALRLRGAAETARRPRGRQWWLVALALGVLAAQAVPVVALALRSVRGREGWTFAAYRAVAERPEALPVSVGQALLTSLRAATDATVIALVVGVLAAAVLARAGRGRAAEALDAALMLPLGVSAVTVGFGYLVTLGSLPGDLRSSALLVPLVQALVAVPLVVRTVLPVLRAVDDRLRQVAATLGAPPRRVWREVDLPLAGRSVLAAAGFAYVIALGEFGATAFLARDEPTLPVAVARLAGRPGELDAQLAHAASTVLVVVTVAVVALVERLRVADVGEF